MRCIRSLLVLSLVLGAAPASAVTIDACGNWFVPPGETADLVADLDCPVATSIQLGRGARLRLNGHRLEGEPGGIAVFAGQARSSIEGPGTIAGWSIGVYLVRRGSRAKLEDIVFEDNGAAVTGSHDEATRVDATDLVVRDGVHGILAHTLVGERVRMTGNLGPAIDVRSLRGTDITVTGSGASELPWAIRVHNARVDGLEVTDNARVGLLASGGVSLRRSNILRNDSSGEGVDIAARRKPILRAPSTCGLSRDLDTGLPFGICLND